MIVEFSPLGVQQPSGPAAFRKHQEPQAPALPTDIANGWPEGGFSGRRTRGNVELPFYAQIGDQRWGGGGRLLPGANSVQKQTPGTGETATPQIANIVTSGKAPRRTFRPMFTLPKADKRGSAHAFHGAGAYGFNENVPPDIVPGNSAFDHGVIGEKMQSPSCASVPETESGMPSTPDQAIQAAAKSGDSLHSVQTLAPGKVGAGAGLRKFFQRPSRAGKKPVHVQQRIFNFRTGGFERYRFIK